MQNRHIWGSSLIAIVVASNLVTAQTQPDSQERTSDITTTEQISQVNDELALDMADAMPEEAVDASQSSQGDDYEATDRVSENLDDPMDFPVDI